MTMIDRTLFKVRNLDQIGSRRIKGNIADRIGQISAQGWDEIKVGRTWLYLADISTLEAISEYLLRHRLKT